MADSNTALIAGLAGGLGGGLLLLVFLISCFCYSYKKEKLKGHSGRDYNNYSKREMKGNEACGCKGVVENQIMDKYFASPPIYVPSFNEVQEIPPPLTMEGEPKYFYGINPETGQPLPEISPDYQTSQPNQPLPQFLKPSLAFNSQFLQTSNQRQESNLANPLQPLGHLRRTSWGNQQTQKTQKLSSQNEIPEVQPLPAQALYSSVQKPVNQMEFFVPTLVSPNNDKEEEEKESSSEEEEEEEEEKEIQEPPRIQSTLGHVYLPTEAPLAQSQVTMKQEDKINCLPKKEEVTETSQIPSVPPQQPVYVVDQKFLDQLKMNQPVQQPQPIVIVLPDKKKHKCCSSDEEDEEEKKEEKNTENTQKIETTSTMYNVTPSMTTWEQKPENIPASFVAPVVNHSSQPYEVQEQTVGGFEDEGLGLSQQIYQGGVISGTSNNGGRPVGCCSVKNETETKVMGCPCDGGTSSNKYFSQNNNNDFESGGEINFGFENESKSGQTGSGGMSFGVGQIQGGAQNSYGGFQWFK